MKVVFTVVYWFYLSIAFSWGAYPHRRQILPGEFRMTPVNVPEKIMDTSLVISLVAFGVRILAKETKAVLGDLFQMLEFTIRWWIYIRSIAKSVVTAPVAANAAVPTE